MHVLVGHLDAGHGVQLTVLRGSGSDLPPLSLIRPPSGPADDPGSGLVAPALAAILGALALTVPAAALIRRLGREQVRSGGAVAAAFDADDDGPVERMTERQMQEITTIEFEAPRDMSAVEGALIVDEKVTDHHKTAWMLESAIRGEIEIRSDDDKIHRGDSIPAPTVSPILSEMFGGRDSIDLGSHDTKFQKGWGRLDSELKGWLRESDHWDPGARSRRTLIGLLAGLISLAGLGVAFGGGWVANKSGTTLLIAAIGGGLFALGANAIIRFWELHVRTPAGSARWLQVESFRRFLHESEAEHVEYAASRGLIRQYSAWAVALDETDAWTDAVRAAAVTQPGRISAGDLAFAYGVSSFHRSTAVASATPSSSGSGFSGGGGGGFSGGGGGGGGSW